MKTPLRYKDAKWEDVPQNIQDSILKIQEARRGIYIHGSVGNGKTHIVYAIGKEIEKKEIAEVRILNCTEMLREFKNYFDRSDKFERDLFEQLLEFRGLLIIDDIGSEKLSEWVIETFYLLINKRYESVLPTIFTSNFNLKELEERIGDRIVSRIVGSCDVISLNGEDRRLPSKIHS